ncbi:MAG TPA: glycosyltransferase [Polyangia bacterium]|jgi:ceramide glucosyltransferase
MSLVLTAVGIVLLVEVILSHELLRRALGTAPRPPALAAYPSVSVIRPIRGLDPGLEENLATAFNQDYPGRVETIFVLDDEHEPALPAVRAAIAAHPQARAHVVLCGPPPADRTGKLNAMILGLRLSRGELVAFVDSDIRPDPTTLRTVVETLLGAPGAGAAFTEVYVPGPTRTVGDAGYALLLNGMYDPAAAAAARRRGGDLPFIMGQFMVLTRAALRAIGGLESAAGELVDDMALGLRLAAAGYRNMIAAHPVPVIQERLPLREFLAIYNRWLTFGRTGLPGLSFKSINWLHGLVFWLGALGAVVAAAAGWPLATALCAAAPVAVTASITRLHHLMGGRLSARHLWAAAGLLLVAPVVLARVLVQREVTWRGRSYRLDGRARLAATPAAPAARSSAPA